jgi:hypothetical protein
MQRATLFPVERAAPARRSASRFGSAKRLYRVQARQHPRQLFARFPAPIFARPCAVGVFDRDFAHRAATRAPELLETRTFTDFHRILSARRSCAAGAVERLKTLSFTEFH